MTAAPPPLTAAQLSALRHLADQTALVIHTDAGPVPLAAVLAWGDAAVAVERKRCADIVLAARFGEIDTDFRSLLYRVTSGGPFPEPEEPT